MKYKFLFALVFLSLMGGVLNAAGTPVDPIEIVKNTALNQAKDNLAPVFALWSVLIGFIMFVVSKQVWPLIIGIIGAVGIGLSPNLATNFISYFGSNSNLGTFSNTSDITGFSQQMSEVKFPKYISDWPVFIGTGLDYYLVAIITFAFSYTVMAMSGMESYIYIPFSIFFVAIIIFLYKKFKDSSRKGSLLHKLQVYGFFIHNNPKKYKELERMDIYDFVPFGYEDTFIS